MALASANLKVGSLDALRNLGEHERSHRDGLRRKTRGLDCTTLKEVEEHFPRPLNGAYERDECNRVTPVDSCDFYAGEFEEAEYPCAMDNRTGTWTCNSSKAIHE